MSATFPFDRARDGAPGGHEQHLAFSSGLDECDRGELDLPALVPVTRDQALPLSYSQQRQWILVQMDPENGVDNIPLAFRMKGKLDLAALARSLQAVVRRHEALRTTFELVDGTPRQVVAPEMAVPISMYDLRGLAHDEQEQRVQTLLRESRRRFDVTRGPLMRAGVIELSQSEHICMLSVHPIVADAWSMGVLYQEMAALYAAFVREMPSPLPALGIQYADYAVWQRAFLSGARLDRLLTYWRQQLDGAPPLLALPADRPRPAMQRYRGERHQVSLDAALTARLHALAEQTNTTLFMVLNAVYAMLLSRYARQDDICVGTIVANRTRADTEALIGLLANSLVLRTRLRKDMSFDQLLSDVRATTLDAYAHQELPFEYLLAALRPERNTSHTPLFQATLILQNTAPCTSALPGLDVEPISGVGVAAKFDLSLECVAKFGQLHCAFDYSSALFDGVTIERMAGHFERLLEAVVAQPSARLGQIEQMLDQEAASLAAQ